jgi:hypothetical protein
LSTITAQPLRQKRSSTCGAGASFEPTLPTGFAGGFPADFNGLRETALRGRTVRRVERRDDRVAAI